MNLKLEKLKSFNGRKGPLLFIIMDGVGIGKQYEGNAVYKANTPTLDKLFKSKLYTQLKAHGTAVGLPSDEDMGNSEVGHNAMGAGRIFDQGAKLVNKAFATDAIFSTDIWRNVVDKSKDDGTIHFIGLLSDGNVHSHIKHLFALLDRCEKEKIEKVRIHILLDGRDVPGKSALNYVTPLEEKLKDISYKNNFNYKIASGGGRMIVTMDRYNADWSIVERGWNAHVRGIGRNFKSATEAINTFYKEDENIIDQYLEPFVIVDKEEQPVGKIKDGDSVVFFNFRGDRAIEISKAFEDDNFNYFDRIERPNVFYAGMMQYDGDTLIPKNFLVQPPEIERTISTYLCAEEVTSFAISETQKFGHVTYFWNGNRSGYINEQLEKYIEIPSDKIEFDKAPKMKAEEIKDKTIEMLRLGKYKFGRLNFANGDMVGHTGNLNAAIVAIETVDKCVSELLDVIKELDGIAVVTADHGNSDEMYIIKNGEKIVKTSHSLNPVPFIIYDSEYNDEYNMKDLDNPGLTNIAGTLLNLLGYENVEGYDESLIGFDLNFK